MIACQCVRCFVPCIVISVAAAFSILPSNAAADESPARPAAKTVSPEREIRATAAAFVRAFNRGDAAAVAALWTADGSAADSDGTIYKGRQAIEAQYAALFKAQPDARIAVAVKSVEFPAPDTAIEDGISQVLAQQAAPPQISRYTAVHVKLHGKWLLAGVRESSVELPSNFARIEDLGWLVGTWKTERDGKSVRTTIRWIANNSFLERNYTVATDGIVTSSGKQIIGWDAAIGRVRSWSFDGAGGTGTGVWTRTPEGWRIESSGVLPDGTPTASRDLLIRIPGENNVFGWRSTARRAGDALLPDTPEVVLDRVIEKGAKKK